MRISSAISRPGSPTSPTTSGTGWRTMPSNGTCGGASGSRRGTGPCTPRVTACPGARGTASALEELNALRRKVIRPLEKLRLGADRTGRGQTMALYQFLEEIGLPRRLLEREEALRARGEPALAEEYRQLWDILCDAMEQCARILGEVPLEREEYARLFSLVLSQYSVGSIPVSLDRVHAGEMPPPGPQDLQGSLPAGGGRRLHPPGVPGAGSAQRRRPEPFGLLWAGAGPQPARPAGPGDDHSL